VSAIVPARNEEASISGCVLSLLEQNDDLEVLVADDGSTDGTAAAVREIAGRDARVRLVAVPPLPPGWVGKNHALHVAARLARGDWLLFTDADTIHAPGRLRAVRERAEREGLDLFSLSPAQQMRNWYERAIIPRVYRQLERLYRFERINDAAGREAAANGQYILIRRSAYEALGGHAALAGDILEDVALARAARRAGLRLRFEPGAGVVSTRMYRSFRALWEGWSKNLYPLYRWSGAADKSAGAVALRLLGTAAGIWLFDVAPAGLAVWTLAAPESGGLKVAATALAWLALRHAWYARRLRAVGERVRLAAWYWPGSVLFSLMLVNSLVKYSFGRPVAWKGREYRGARCQVSGVRDCRT
jgi:glycosyltransferase involved in cell wall biosynthesis